jgi:hypothetical protein
MITEHNGYFLLSTRATSLLLRVNEIGKLVSEYYGTRLVDEREWPSLCRLYSCTPGTSVAYDEVGQPNVSLDIINSELSTGNQGDFLTPSLILSNDSTVNFDFRLRFVHRP